jgi:hypothetical protein
MRYDGSSFHMGRDGYWLVYQGYRVPAEVEAGWRRELTDKYLDALDRPGNWMSVYFFDHHGDLTHFDEVVAATPQGVFWEKCAFLEHLLRYADKCSVEVPQPRIHEVYQDVLRHARRLAREAREPKHVQRIERLKERAEGSHRVRRVGIWERLRRTRRC